METTDEKFFESLAEGKNIEAEDGVEIELAKAGAGTLSRQALGARTAKKASEPETEGQLTIDVYQTPTEIVIESAIAGVRPEDIDINVTNDSITIRGARHHEREVKDHDYLYQECYWGRFSRSVILPQEIDPEEASVGFKSGILTIRLPKANKQKSKKLKVSSD
jgi:HSP20 family protein